ncbi:MAG: hypothetical protein ACXWXL_22125 [Candidatus Binatia bacterium]
MKTIFVNLSPVCLFRYLPATNSRYQQDDRLTIDAFLCSRYPNTLIVSRSPVRMRQI